MTTLSKKIAARNNEANRIAKKARQTFNVDCLRFAVAFGAVVEVDGPGNPKHNLGSSSFKLDRAATERAIEALDGVDLSTLRVTANHVTHLYVADSFYDDYDEDGGFDRSTELVVIVEVAGETFTFGVSECEREATVCGISLQITDEEAIEHARHRLEGTFGQDPDYDRIKIVGFH
jgi:hypothetical protein